MLTAAEGIATLTFDRPGRRNSLDRQAWIELRAAVERIAADAGLLVAIVRGANGDFAAGADIAEFDEVFATRESTLAHLALMGETSAALEALDRPVIAQIEGHCVGAGVAVALACDLRIAADTARLAVTPAKLGLIYSLADTRRLVAATGLSTARDLLFTGRTLAAAEALACGLVDAVVPAAELAEAVAAKARLIAHQSQWSVRTAKAVLRRVADGQLADDDITRGWFADATSDADYREGLAAFRARRAPVFPSR